MFRARVLFVHGYPLHGKASFVQQDMLLLSQTADVEELSLHGFGRRGWISRMPEILHAVKRNDIVFAWFGAASRPAVLAAQVLHRPTIIVAGGSDVVSLPSIQYGMDPSWSALRRFRTTLGLRLASKVLLFSDSSLESFRKLPGVDPRKGERLYLGVDIDRYKPAGAKRPCALTIAYIKSNNLQRKGLLTFVRAAGNSRIPYRLGGRLVDQAALDTIESLAPANLTYIGELSDEQLVAEYQRTMVYAQLSIHEGFGMALAEAMACGCVPVVTRVGAIPEVVGDVGVYVPVDDPIATADAIARTVSGWTEQHSRRARERVADLFPLHKRLLGLHKAIEELL